MSPSGIYATNSGGHFYFALRYTPGCDLARRFPKAARGRFRTHADAERIRVLCPHADDIQVVDVRTGKAQ